MANISGSSQPSDQRVGIMNHMNFDSMVMPSQRPSKEIAPLLPVDPFRASTSLYIPPEEIHENEVPLDEIMGWVMSDDQQDTEEEDDEMDDNEFDLDFDDADYPPHVKSVDPTPSLWQRHMLQSKYNTLQSTPYMPPNSTIPVSPLMSRDSIAEYGAELDRNSPPVKFINPSSLYLPSKWPLFSNNGIARDEGSTSNDRTYDASSSTHEVAGGNNSMSTENYSNSIFGASNNNELGNNVDSAFSSSHIPSTSSAQGPSPSLLSGLSGLLGSPHQNSTPPSAPVDSPTMSLASPEDHADNGDGNTISGNISNSTPDFDVGDINIDLDMNDLYPVHSEPENEDDFAEKSSPAVESAAVEQPEPQSHSLPSEDLVSDLHDAQHDGPVLGKVSHARTAPEKSGTTVERAIHHPRRKTTRRKTASSHRVSSSSSHSSAHVCNMKYPDGAECHRSFTRPYDLARHQETLHAAVRKMYTCEVCGENSKTFSRLDALSRHMRLKHA